MTLPFIICIRLFCNLLGTFHLLAVQPGSVTTYLLTLLIDSKVGFNKICVSCKVYIITCR